MGVQVGVRRARWLWIRTADVSGGWVWVRVGCDMLPRAWRGRLEPGGWEGGFMVCCVVGRG